MNRKQAILILCAVGIIAFFAFIAIMEVNPVAQFSKLSGKKAEPVMQEPPASQLMHQAGELNLERNSTGAKRIYGQVSKEHPGSYFAGIAEARLKEIGLEGYFRGLNEQNSETYIVQYGDTLRRIGDKFGITPGLVRAANKIEGDIIRPNMELKIMKDKWSLVADKSTNTMVLKAGELAVKTYPIGTGKEETSTPVGDFKIVNRLTNPTWYYQGTVAPPGSPENPLGTRWLGFDKDGYGLHGTTDPDSVGQHKSLGCIRMLNPEVEELFELISVGTQISVIESAKLPLSVEVPAKIDEAPVSPEVLETPADPVEVTEAAETVEGSEIEAGSAS